MYFPVRCFTCGAPVGDRWDDYDAKTKAGAKPADVLSEMGIDRYCCRRMFISHVEVMEKVNKYSKL